MWADLIIVWASLGAGIGIGLLMSRSKPLPPTPPLEKRPIPQPHLRGGPAPVLRFMFTLDGEPTGEMVPEDAHPVTAAEARSRVTGKDYGACRV